jgi:hypothetical protein
LSTPEIANQLYLSRNTARTHMMERTMLLETFYREPGSAPHLETPIDHGNLVVAVSMPAPPEGRPLGLPQGARAGQL